MKRFSGIWSASLALGGSALATVVNIGTVEQPVNLGAKSDPSRIPLGPVVVETNHGYGSHLAISEPRPCTHGALDVARGLELNMNLASVFGIEVIPEDETQVPQRPVTLKVKDWPVPSYSPYRKDQVLAATLHCLLRSVHAPPETPLRILIDAENPEDAKNLAGFAGDYLTAEAGEQGGPTPVPGTRLDTDWRGVTSVVLTEAKPPDADALRRPAPVLVPFHIRDGTDDVSYDLIPVWAGDTWDGERLDLVARPVTLFYDYYDQTRSSGPDINSLTKFGLLSKFSWQDGPEGSRLNLRIPLHAADAPPDLANTLASLCYALVLTTQPTEHRPLTISVGLLAELLEGPLASFRDSADWKIAPGPANRESVATCEFAWDHGERAFSRGSVPLGNLEFNRDRPWSVTFPPAGQVVDAAGK